MIVLAALLIVRVGIAADNRPVPISQRGVDRLSSSRGPDLLGAVLRKTPRGDVVMAIRREWLQQSDAERLKRLDEELAASSTRAWRRLIERIDTWRAVLKPNDPLLVSLSLERTRVVNQLKAVEASGRVPATRFVLLSIPATDASVLTPAYGNVPTLILGPGEAAMAHQTDEYCYVDRIGQAVEAYMEIALRWNSS